jgi:hypothetical protein
MPSIGAEGVRKSVDGGITWMLPDPKLYAGAPRFDSHGNKIANANFFARIA